MATAKATTKAKLPKMKIKRGDLVQVISGPRDRTLPDGRKTVGDRGKQGKVIAVFPKTRRVLVEGINGVTKHVKADTTGRGARTGGLTHTEAPIHVSNVAVVDPETKTPTRVGTRVDSVERDGRAKAVRVRVAKKSKKDL